MNHLEHEVIKVFLNKFMDEPLKQFRFPKSKKKRIRKKFRKNKQNYKPEIKFIHDKTTNNIFVGKLGYEIMQNQLSEKILNK